MFADFLDMLYIVQRYLDLLRSTEDSLAVVTKGDIDIVRLLSLNASARVQNEAFRILTHIKDDALKRFPVIREDVLAVSPGMMHPVDYEVHELLCTYVNTKLRKRFPSVLGVNLGTNEIPLTASILYIPSLGKPAIVFADKAEAEACRTEIPQFSTLDVRGLGKGA